MLELPEVEVLRKDLDKEVVGKRVQDEESEKGAGPGIVVETPSIVRPFHRTRPDFISALQGHKIEDCRRRGTVLFLGLPPRRDGQREARARHAHDRAVHHRWCAAPVGPRP